MAEAALPGEEEEVAVARPAAVPADAELVEAIREGLQETIESLRTLLDRLEAGSR